MNGPQWSARSSWHTFPGHPVDTGIPRADSASPVPARAAPHTRASACTHACTLYGCAARAPHGNDESSTLEHLSPLVRSVALVPSASRTRGFLSLPRWFSARRALASPSHPRWIPRAESSDSLYRTYPPPVYICESCVHVTHDRMRANVGRGGRVMISRLFTRVLSLSDGIISVIRALSCEVPLFALALARAAVRCWQICVAAGICFRFQWFMPVNGSRARESVMLGVIDDSYRWGARVCFSQECGLQAN